MPRHPRPPGGGGRRKAHHTHAGHPSRPAVPITPPSGGLDCLAPILGRTHWLGPFQAPPLLTTGSIVQCTLFRRCQRYTGQLQRPGHPESTPPPCTRSRARPMTARPLNGLRRQRPGLVMHRPRRGVLPAREDRERRGPPSAMQERRRDGPSPPAPFAFCEAEAAKRPDTPRRSTTGFTAMRRRLPRGRPPALPLTAM